MKLRCQVTGVHTHLCGKSVKIYEQTTSRKSMALVEPHN